MDWSVLQYFIEGGEIQSSSLDIELQRLVHTSPQKSTKLNGCEFPNMDVQAYQAVTDEYQSHMLKLLEA